MVAPTRPGSVCMCVHVRIKQLLPASEAMAAATSLANTPGHDEFQGNPWSQAGRKTQQRLLTARPVGGVCLCMPLFVCLFLVQFRFLEELRLFCCLDPSFKASKTNCTELSC